MDQSSHPSPTNYPFLAGGGEMGALIRAIDWSANPLGEPSGWPPALQQTVAMMLTTSFPVLVCWGEDYIQLYNDAFRPINGKSKHPQAMGGSAKTTYAEIWAQIGPMFYSVRQGQTVGFPNFMVPLDRNGYSEDCYFDFSYSPIADLDGNIQGVLVICMETTEKVKAIEQSEKAQVAVASQRDRLTSFFMQAPAGICILDGPHLVYELVNPAYQQLLPGRKLLNRPIFEALPELIGTPLHHVLLNVYQTGESYEINELLIPVAEYEGGPTRDRYFSFNYQARRDEKSQVDGILVFVFEVTGMMNVQQELQKARELAEQQKRVYEAITSGTPDLMYVFSLDYRFIYANSALLTMWGKTWDNAIGKGLLENGYEPWHAEMHEREIDQVRATKQPVRGEVSFPHATLGKRVYDYILTPVLNAQGEVEAVAGTTRDISDRKQSEEALANSSEELQAINEEMTAVNEEQAASNEELRATNEELAAVNEQLLEAQQKIEESEIALRLAINAANFGTWFIHSVTREFVTDARLKELFGYYQDEALSIEQALAQITEEYRGYVATKLENAIYRNGDYDVTYPVIGLHDNQLRWLRAIGNLKADPSGAFSAFTGVVMDVTEQYLSAQKIEQAEEGLRMAIESGELAVWHLDERLGKIIASARFNELFGFAADEEVPYTAAVTQILPEYRGLVQEAVTASFTGAANFNVEYPIIGFHDGKQRWVRSVGKFVSDAKNGNYITGVMADITEQKMDEIRKNDFIGMVSHELKTPLTSLTAIVQVLNAKLQNSEDSFVPGALEKANVQVKRMSNMINGFLNISRLESGKIHIEKQIFDMETLIIDTIDEAKLTASTHLIHFTRCAPIPINADRDKIGSVISNFISNAIKYSPKGKNIEVACNTTDGQVIVSVKDEGMGIKPEDLNKIFNRYYRVETNHTRHISGFGIGLYLSAEIVRRHEGEIWAESKSGIGSTFFFSLPL